MNSTLRPGETMQDLIRRLETAFDTVSGVAPVAYWYETLDENGRLLDIRFSDGMREMLGYSAEEFPDRLPSLLDRIHPDDARRVMDILISACRGDIDRFTVEYRTLAAGGEYLWVSATGQDVIDAEGRIAGIFGAVIDISGRRAREHLDRKLKRQGFQLQEALTFTNFFLGTYTSAYYVNLKDLSCRVYKRTEDLEAQFPVTGGYYESLSAYIEQRVHPDDRAALLEVSRPERMREMLRVHPEYIHIFRDISGGTEKNYRMQIIRGADEDHAAFGFVDITEELREQQRLFLGAVPISPDILTKANVGLWAFELDEGRPPRMYADEAMLGLLGLKEQVPPEQIYHAWYDHIDAGSYGLVSGAVERMQTGFAEVQYPWHHPDGHTMIVRCGGVRNPAYTGGIRIEGTHQDVTEVVHFDEAEVKRLRQAEVKLQHEQLRAEVLNYMIDHDDDDPVELLKRFAERLRVLTGCDQVIYRDLEETRIMVNSPAIEDTWHVPIGFCRQCQHFDAHHPMYAGGFTEMENCREGWQGIPVYHECPIKSSLTRIVYCDSEAAGYLAIHYVQDFHRFTDLERETLEDFARYISLCLSRYHAKKENRELRLREELTVKLAEQQVLLDYFVKSYNSAYSVDLAAGTFEILHMDHEFANVFGENGNSLEAMKTFIDEHIHPDDRAMMRLYTDRQYIESRLLSEPSFTFTVREILDGEEKVMRGLIIRVRDADHIAVGFMDITEELRREQEHQARINEFNRIVGALSSDFGCVDYVELTEDRMSDVSVVLRSSALARRVIPGWEQEKSFTKRLDMLCRYAVCESDRQKFFEDTHREKVMSELEHADSYYVNVRFLIDGAIRYYQIKFSAVRDQGAIIGVVAGLHSVDEQMRREIETQQKLRTNLEIIEALAADYSSVYYVDLETGKATPYAMTSEIREEMHDILEGATDYGAAYRAYVEKFVYEPDRAMMLREGRKERVLPKLAADHAYIIT
ncbi:MAG: hypothetical protein CW338_09500, partial [Clostridiales bacterium]|nr:hypothetical protein [Clostridiales bacterium]